MKETENSKIEGYSCLTPSHHHNPKKLSLGQQLKFQADDENFLGSRHFYITENLRTKALKQESKPEQGTAQKFVKKLADNLTKEYPHISTYQGVFGGEPHLKGHRFAVTDVLAGLIVHNSFDGIVKAYKGAYTEEQLKQAVRFALYFIKNAYCLESECE